MRLVVHELRNTKTDADDPALGGRDQPLGQLHSIRQHDGAARGLGRDRFAQNDRTAGGVDDPAAIFVPPRSMPRTPVAARFI